MLPAAFAGSGAHVLVGGKTAENADYFDAVTNPTPYVLAFVLGLSFIVLTIAFRSIMVALVSILLNLLSVGAAYGLLTLVFLDGKGARLLGFQHVHSIDAWFPLFLFSVLFGLSMDYQVFLMSRIKERYDQSGSTREAVTTGVATTARIITGAALIIVVVFTGFARGQLVMFQQMGFGVAIALLLDATIIRSVVLPSTLSLLDQRTWYLQAGSNGSHTSKSNGPIQPHSRQPKPEPPRPAQPSLTVVVGGGEVDLERLAGGCGCGHLDRDVARDCVDAVPARPDPHQAAGCLQRERAGRPLAEFVRLEHDQNSAHRRGRSARNEHGSRQQHGAAPAQSVLPIAVVDFMALTEETARRRPRGRHYRNHTARPRQLTPRIRTIQPRRNPKPAKKPSTNAPVAPTGQLDRSPVPR